MQKQDKRWEYRGPHRQGCGSIDIASLKTVMQDRLRATEEKLMEELHATREALWDELFGELEVKFTTKEQLESAMHSARGS